MNNQNTLPDPQTAYDTLFSRVHAQVFFNKCASAGIVPQTQEQAQEMLNIAGKLRMVTQDAQVKAAAAVDDPFQQMSRSLDGVISEYGLAQPSHLEVERGYKQAGDELANDPELYNAVLAMKAAEAAFIQEELAAQQKRQ